MKRIKKIFKRILSKFGWTLKRSTNIGDRMIFRLTNDFLKKSGWNRSASSGQSVDVNGAELPWFTYSFIEFCTPRLKSNFKIFEFGSGNSTMWFSKLTANVISVEHDLEWYNKVKIFTQDVRNLEYFHKDELNGEYSSFVGKYEDEFDIIVIDGRDRINCALNSLNALKPDGVIIWDNSDRHEYKEGYDFLISNGFKRLDFIGLGPINTYGWSTSIFYRNNNCFNI